MAGHGPMRTCRWYCYCSLAKPVSGACTAPSGLGGHSSSVEVYSRYAANRLMTSQFAVTHPPATSLLLDVGHQRLGQLCEICCNVQRFRETDRRTAKLEFLNKPREDRDVQELLDLLFSGSSAQCLCGSTPGAPTSGAHHCAGGRRSALGVGFKIPDGYGQLRATRDRQQGGRFYEQIVALIERIGSASWTYAAAWAVTLCGLVRHASVGSVTLLGVRNCRQPRQHRDGRGPGGNVH
jgi:hypothetical protein